MAGDTAAMERESARAWDALTATFEILRGEQDDRYLPKHFMEVDTGLVVEAVTRAKQADMISARGIEKTDARALTLREALNKIAHYSRETSTFRLDRRGAHYLVLGGRKKKEYWVAEILVSRLCRNASAAAKGIKKHI